ncbi:MAG TPA: hypothetical protein ENH29_01870 [Bacteroidetes bacterium]|nr:hypothetical protein [Bacteroidota bacterium]
MLKRTDTATKPVKGVPFTRFVGDLNRKKIILVASSGIAPRLQEFREPETGYYVYPKEIQIDDLYLPKKHFGIEDIEHDLNVLFPIDSLRALAEEGLILAPTDEHVSMYGYHFVIGHIRNVVAPYIAEVVEGADAGGAIILSGCMFCHRMAAVLQRAIEDRGIPSVIVSQYPKMSLYYEVSRIFYPVGFKTGHAVGPPNFPELHKKVLKDALELLVSATEPLTLVEKEYPEYPDPRPKRKYLRKSRE